MLSKSNQCWNIHPDYFVIIKEIYTNLFQFTQLIPPIQFTIHQYLLNMEEPMLMGTGTMKQAEEMLQQIKLLLGEKELKYILVSHMESDECGGLSAFRKAYPKVTVICSELTARELSGYGYYGNINAKKGGDTLYGNGFDLTFIDYPSEVHLQNGLVFFEKNRGIFFSSDLMLRMGNGSDQVIKGDWKTEIESISSDRICNESAKEILKKTLLDLHPNFVAVGHGFCLEV